MTTKEIPKPVPVVDEDTKPFWEYCKKHELRMQKCKNCGEIRYPVSAICPNCLNLESEWVKVSGKGKVYSYIVVRRQYHPAFAKDLPYVVAIIETQEGKRMLSNVIGCKPEEVKIGMPVEVAFEDVSAEFALPKFKAVK